MVFVLAGVGICALIFAAIFFWWFCDGCFTTSDTVVVYNDHPSEVVVHEVHYVDDSPEVYYVDESPEVHIEITEEYEY